MTIIEKLVERKKSHCVVEQILLKLQNFLLGLVHESFGGDFLRLLQKLIYSLKI